MKPHFLVLLVLTYSPATRTVWNTIDDKQSGFVLHIQNDMSAFHTDYSAPARISKGQGAGAKRAQCQNKKGTLPQNGISAYPLSHMIIYPLQSPL